MLLMHITCFLFILLIIEHGNIVFNIMGIMVFLYAFCVVNMLILLFSIVLSLSKRSKKAHAYGTNPQNYPFLLP